ncbi:MAG: hypothetical protein JHC57_01455 [Sphingopyxis sp.]|uniref:hypothetical protein n=1 Tax=Sphingopyxis sp. TaxID=1908224 RepID=UPI001A1897F9|nr:hypothetical protein [Sphingopyxis sp.]MBJ7498401.1 hypothetical protein [Sphingopyxis sp.]
MLGAGGWYRFHFCTAFKKATGRNPRETLTMMRIARAKELLVRDVAGPDHRHMHAERREFS